MKSKFNFKAFDRYLKAEGLENESRSNMLALLEDFIRYGKRKPYMTIEEFNNQLNKEIERLRTESKAFDNAYAFKIKSDLNFSWQNVKSKTRYFLEAFEKEFGEFEHYTWAVAENDINFEVNIIVNLKNNKPKIVDLENFAMKKWYFIKNVVCGRINYTSQIIHQLNQMKEPNKSSSIHTWYLKNSKIFTQSYNFFNYGTSDQEKTRELRILKAFGIIE